MPVSDPLRPAVRLRILSALHTLPPAGQITLERLRRIVDIADDALDQHLAALGAARYLAAVTVEVDGAPRPVVLLTDQGRAAFEAHLQRLRDTASGTHPA